MAGGSKKQLFGHRNAWVPSRKNGWTVSLAETLITGATGLVGSAVARKLVGEGIAVRALVRRGSPRSHLTELGLEFIEGDMRDARAVRAAMAGIRHVFHVAADYRLWAPDPNEIFAANVDGTRIMMQEAKSAGVERIVYTSSVATIALRADGSPADESIGLSVEEGVGTYKRSKIAAERLVEAMVADGKLPAVIVNPSTPIGPRDVKPTPTGRIIVEAARGRMPGFLDTGLNLVHVDDVADGHLAALKHGTVGERYILGGENVLLADMLADIAGLVGRRPPRLRIPRAAALSFAYAAEATARLTGRAPFSTLDGVRMADHHMFFTAAKAERELGFRARPYRAALADAVAWFKAAGYLDGKRQAATSA
jgi:dihydroflavonol-4-reductase